MNTATDATIADGIAIGTPKPAPPLAPVFFKVHERPERCLVKSITQIQFFSSVEVISLFHTKVIAFPQALENVFVFMSLC